jgi:NAD(P)-dependent dehydrogenase (short-subunit alcohol dehydrogenase family)
MTESLPAEVVERARGETALKRLAKPEDVAQAVDFLCRDEAGHLTGVVLRVDGGQALAAESV